MGEVTILVTANGYIVRPGWYDHSRIADTKEMYVFNTFEDLAEWLKVSLAEPKPPPAK